MRVALLFKSFGPYHIARLGALKSRCDVVPIEYVQFDCEYDWGAVESKLSHGVVSLAERTSWLGSAAAKRRLELAFRKFRPTVVAVPGWSEPLSLHAALVCRKLGIPAILMGDSWRGSVLRRGPVEWTKKQLLRLFGAALVGGTPQQDYLVKLGFPEERIKMGYDVVDNLHFEAGARMAKKASIELRALLSLPKEYFLCCSRLVPGKNLLNLLAAFARYRRNHAEPWDLVIAGEGPLRRRLESFINDNSLAGAVHLKGRVSYSQLPLVYGLAKAFVLPSANDTWGLVVNEAMAAGLPLIVSRGVGSHSDLVSVWKNGFTFEPTDVAELARLLAIVATSDQLYSWGGVSRDIIKSWGVDRFAEQLCEASEIACEAGTASSIGLGAVLARALAIR